MTRNEANIIHFSMAFLFYIRHINLEVLSIVQSFLHRFVGNEGEHFFEIYFRTLLGIISQLSGEVRLPQDSKIESSLALLKRDVAFKLNVGFEISSTVTCSTIELFSVLLNFLQIFPKLEAFDKIRRSRFIAMTSSVEGYLMNLIGKFRDESLKERRGETLPQTVINMKDLVFLVQEPLRLLIKKQDYKFCLMGLICQIADGSVDMIVHCRHLMTHCYAVMQAKQHQPDDIKKKIDVFVEPFIRIVFRGWGLVLPETVVYTSNVLADAVIKNRRFMDESMYSHFRLELPFLNLVKSQHIANIEDVSSKLPVFGNLDQHTDQPARRLVSKSGHDSSDSHFP